MVSVVCLISPFPSISLSIIHYNIYCNIIELWLIYLISIKYYYNMKLNWIFFFRLAREEITVVERRDVDTLSPFVALTAIVVSPRIRLSAVSPSVIWLNPLLSVIWLKLPSMSPTLSPSCTSRSHTVFLAPSMLTSSVFALLKVAVIVSPQFVSNSRRKTLPSPPLLKLILV